MPKLTTLLIKIPRDTVVTPEATQTFLSALVGINSLGKLKRLSGEKPKAFALEITLVNQQIGFFITCDTSLVPFIGSQIQSSYPLALLEKTKDPLEGQTDLYISYLKLKEGDYYPLATYPHFSDIDPMSAVLSVLAKTSPDKSAVVQIALQSTSQNWQAKGASFAEHGTKNEDGTYSARSDQTIIKEKISYPGFRASIRIASNSPELNSEVIKAFGVFTRADGNSLYASTPNKLVYKKELRDLVARQTADKQIVNIIEIATIWHLPGEKIKTPSIVWGQTVLSEPPANLPVSLGLDENQKANINFFAKTQYKNLNTTFGIKNSDRLRHIWTVGKTGTGKSTMIANMAIDDIKKGRGLGVIDPHGDLCDDILDYIPKHRINDTIYFNPADRNFPIVINPLEVNNREEAELVVSGLMAIFTKVWANVWSARMEYILRNSFLTLTEIPNATLADVLKLLASPAYRKKVYKKITDKALLHFWKEEFERMPEKLQKEAISPIQNKVGQFVTSPMIRNIIGHSKSSISLDEIMNSNKIFLANLSQGRLGEDNAQLLGAMLITKFQTAAMRRVDIAKIDRVPFYLYVDEFQNFATSSFIKILSEARKYKLALLLANQYMAQIPSEVQQAILGNAGTIISFTAGAEDASILHKEYAEVFSENDLINLSNYQIAVKLMVDEHSTRPFLAHTLPLPVSRNSNRGKVIKVSRERWTGKAKNNNTKISINGGAKETTSLDIENQKLSSLQKKLEKLKK